MEARYTVKVDHGEDMAVVEVHHLGRHIATHTVRSYGDCANLGLLLIGRATPFLPVHEQELHTRRPTAIGRG